VEGLSPNQIIEDIKEAYHGQNGYLVKDAHSHKDEMLTIVLVVEEDEESIKEQKFEEDI
jgi:hypothetical protein